jgi:hypothetical protein
VAADAPLPNRPLGRIIGGWHVPSALIQMGQFSFSIAVRKPIIEKNCPFYFPQNPPEY